MRRMVRLVRRGPRALAAVFVMLALAGAAQAQSSSDAAFLFAYRIKPGMEGDFAKGYRRHLDWHSTHADSIAWLAWYVVDGTRVGTFVDGAFGIGFRAFDARVDPVGDGQDAAQNVTAYAEPSSRDVYRLRRDLSSSTRLELAKPAAMQRVVAITVKPGSEPTLERAAAGMRANGKPMLDYAVYERISGGAQPAYLVVAQLAAWAELDSERADPGTALLRAAGLAIAHAESETWQLLPALTYIPKR